jgi:hypothetical protein
MRFVPSKSSLCFIAGPFLHKSLEIELGTVTNQGLSVGWQFRSRGDHAGLRCWLDLFRVYFSFSIQDDRHWNWQKNRWCEPGDEPEFEGYPHE